VKDLLAGFDKAFEHRARLAIMSLLMVNDRVEFTLLKEELALTDGNLASHLMHLEKEGYLRVHKSFVGRKPLTQYSATASGTAAFNRHLKALEAFLKQKRK